MNIHAFGGICRLFVRHFDDFVVSLVNFAIFTPDFYGMKRAWVGAFTDFGTF